jgi:hypothetical protein
MELNLALLVQNRIGLDNEDVLIEYISKYRHTKYFVVKICK